MATELTFASIFSGRMPAVAAGSKVPGPGLKVKYGILTVGTSEYPAAGWAAADLETITGFTRIEAIVPSGHAVNGSGNGAFPISWEPVGRTLKLASVTTTGDTEKALTDMTANSALADAATFGVLIFGY